MHLPQTPNLLAALAGGTVLFLGLALTTDPLGPVPFAHGLFVLLGTLAGVALSGASLGRCDAPALRLGAGAGLALTSSMVVLTTLLGWPLPLALLTGGVLWGGVTLGGVSGWSPRALGVGAVAGSLAGSGSALAVVGSGADPALLVWLGLGGLSGLWWAGVLEVARVRLL